MISLRKTPVKFTCGSENINTQRFLEITILESCSRILNTDPIKVYFRDKEKANTKLLKIGNSFSLCLKVLPTLLKTIQKYC